MQTTQDLAYWLQGMLEYTDINGLDEKQAKVLLEGIKDHLGLVFKKVTKSAKELQEVKKDTPNLPDLGKSVKELYEEYEKKAKELQPYQPIPARPNWPGISPWPTDWASPATPSWWPNTQPRLIGPAIC